MPVKRRKALWHPSQFDAHAAYALKAMQRGEATDIQQKYSLDWLINDVCQTYEEAFEPTNARVTDYVLGRMSVGRDIRKHLNIDMQSLVVLTRKQEPKDV